MADRAPAVPENPLDWRPQQPMPARRALEIRDPIVEPLWSGTRVIAHLDHGWEAGVGPASGVRMIDSFGVDLAAEAPELAEAFRSAVRAEDAIFDGILTDQATRSGAGAAIVTEARVSMMRMLTTQDTGVEVARRDEHADPREAFVAFDLLRLDGESLLDLPLLERKRLLESVLDQSELVRVSVHARPPVEGWVASWKAAGLKGAMLKGANSRYVPGGLCVAWRAVTRVAGRR